VQSAADGFEFLAAAVALGTSGIVALIAAAKRLAGVGVEVVLLIVPLPHPAQLACRDDAPRGLHRRARLAHERLAPEPSLVSEAFGCF
jgi:hypothetical protein